GHCFHIHKVFYPPTFNTIGISVSTQRGPLWSRIGMNFHCETAFRTVLFKIGLPSGMPVTVTSPASLILTFTRTVVSTLFFRNVRRSLVMYGSTRVFSLANASAVCISRQAAGAAGFAATGATASATAIFLGASHETIWERMSAP